MYQLKKTQRARQSESEEDRTPAVVCFLSGLPLPSTYSHLGSSREGSGTTTLPETALDCIRALGDSGFSLALGSRCDEGSWRGEDT